MEKVDVLLMVDNSLDTVGGAEESTKIIIDGIKDIYRVGVIQPGKIKNQVQDVTYYQIAHKTRLKHIIKNPLAFIKYIWNVKKIIRTQDPKIIHTQAQVSFFIVALLRKLKLVPNTFKLVHTERGLYIRYSNFFKQVFFQSMKELDVLVTTTKFNMNYWKSALKKKEIKLDYSIIENTAGKLFEIYNQKRKKENEDILTVSFAGRYNVQKNWPLAVEICEKLESKLPGKLYINMAVGCLDNNSYKKVENMFEHLNKILGMRFNGIINVNLEKMDELYYETDIFILTSLKNSESFGRTLVEAMSRKTVVLTTNAGGPVEIVENKENVCTHSEEFVDKSLQFFYNKELMTREKNNNLNRVRKKYSLDNNIRNHLDLYQELLKYN